MSVPNSSTKFMDLPTELIVEICLDCDIPDLLLICKDLRDIICSTPLFWRSIRIREHQHTEEAVTFVGERLKRGGTCPIHICIRSTEETMTIGVELWQKLAAHKDRILQLDISTDTMLLSGRILHAVLLEPEAAILPSLRVLDVRHDEDLIVKSRQDPMCLQILLHPIADIYPSLTMLALPFLGPCIPYPDSPLWSLKTLVLDGSMSWSCEFPNIYQVTQLLAQTPNLETFWCKDHAVRTHQNIDSPHLVLLPKYYGTLSVKLPVILPRLTKMALVVPGYGIDLMCAIRAPMLQDLHLDGRRDDAEPGNYETPWLSWHPGCLQIALELTAFRSRSVRRLSLVGAYLERETWEWILGCRPPDDEEVRFAQLESVAVRGMRAVENEVANAVDDSLLELYATQGSARLRRFVYVGSEPLLGGEALIQLAKTMEEKQLPGKICELELDENYDDDTYVQLNNLPAPSGIKVVLHEEPVQMKGWWEVGKYLDPCESESY